MRAHCRSMHGWVYCTLATKLEFWTLHSLGLELASNFEGPFFAVAIDTAM
jgi:hypothetical protein